MFKRILWSICFASVVCASMSLALAEKDAGEKSAEQRPTAAIGNDGLIYTMPPSEHWEVAPAKENTVAAFKTIKHDAVVAMQIMPSDFSVIDSSSSRVILMQLRGQYKKNKEVKLLIEPNIEQDDRFALRIHERFEMGTGAEKKVMDQLHFYRYAGKFMIQMTVNTFVKTEEQLKETQGEAEDVLFSITGPGVKKPTKSTSRPASATRPASRPTTRPKGNGLPIPRPPKPE